MPQNQDHQNLEGRTEIPPSRIWKMSKPLIVIVGGAALGTLLGHEYSEKFLPIAVSPPYYVEQVAQNFAYTVGGAAIGGATASILYTLYRALHRHNK